MAEDVMGIVKFGDAVSLVEQLFERSNYNSVHILTDENTYAMCLPLFEELDLPCPIHDITIPAGEEHKTVNTCAKVWRALIAQSADRGSLMINLGGGVITDLGGFCAASFMRGMPFVHVPTSVLAMTDAAIGGKTGVDFDTFKNYVGVFAEPEAVIVDVSFLGTLDNRQRRNGLAEVLKHGFINDPGLVDEITGSNDMDVLDWRQVLKRSVATKLKLIEGDPFDRGIRAALNFGHTIGHAIESYSMTTSDPLHHGEAIALGMLVEAKIASVVCGLDAGGLSEIESAVEHFFHATRFPRMSLEELHLYIMKDKKKSGADVLYSLINALGKPVIGQIVPETVVNEAYLHYAKQ